MKDDSLEELLEWDITENKTVTAWSSQVSAKNRGRKTYSRRRGGSFASRRGSLTSSRAFSESSDPLSSQDEETAAELELGIPPPPRPSKLARANSVTMHDRQQAPRMRRANSISHSSTSSFQGSGTMLVRQSSMPRQTFSSLSDLSENLDPNLTALEELVSPKRSKPAVDVRGRKKVRAENSIPKIPVSNCFSNLAKFGEDGLSWAKPNASFSNNRIATETISLTLSHKKSISSDFDYSEFTESSPAGASSGSNRKRGICGSPLDDFDDCSFSAAPSIRRSYFFSPASMSSSPCVSLNEREGNRDLLRSGSSGSNKLKRGSSRNEFESDDALSDAEDSGDDASAESMGHATTPMDRFTYFGNNQRRQSPLGYSPEHLLEPGKAEANDVIKSMSSHLDLRFLVKSLRKEKSGSRASWHVAPPVAWDSNRRSAFFQWTTRSLGFSFRAGGMAVAYLQISKSKGARMLELLESAVASYKQHGLGLETPVDTTEKPRFPFSIPMSRALSLTPKELTSDAQNLVPPSTNAVDDDLLKGMASLGMSEQKTQPSQEQRNHPIASIIFEDSDDMSCIDSSRPSLENHTSATELMAHMHGMTPVPRRSRPPRLSLQSIGSAATNGTASKYNQASPFPPLSTVGGKSLATDFVMTPMVKPQDQGWGCCPVEGRDWGSSQRCSPPVIEELSRRLEQSGIDAGIMDDMMGTPGVPEPSGSNLLDLELEAVSDYNRNADSPASTGNFEDLHDQGIRDSLSQASSADQLGTPVESFVDSFRIGFSQARQDRRRQTSFAKHTRMSLIASAVNPRGSMLQVQGRKSLFLRPTQASFKPGELVLPETLDMEAEFAPLQDTLLEELACSRRAVLADESILETIFGFLQETELLCTASLVSSQWADAATQAHANMMLMSVGCLGTSEAFDDESDDEESVSEGAVAIPGLMEREWSYLVSTFPWACFLSEGAFKRVYKVFNGMHRVEEAVSVMDVNVIESTGNMSVVGAELAVSVLLSSLVRRGVCPNFVVTRGLFSCAHEPPDRHWGTSENKRPRGACYVSPKVKRLPKEPGLNKRGRYQYIRMELCDGGDAEEYLKSQPNEAIPPSEARKFLFQMAFSLHAAADRFSLKHYDVKLLNFFLQGVKSDKTGGVVMRYGLGEHTFALRSAPGKGVVAKLADYGTANVDSGSCGQPVTIAQFTTLENTPIDFLILGDAAHQGHGHDCFGLGLCMLHLFTGHAPYEEILEDVNCPQNLKRELRTIWENEEESDYSVIRSLILSGVYKDEEGHIIEGEPDEVLYDTLYRFIVLFGIPDVQTNSRCSKVLSAVKRSLDGGKSAKERRACGSKNSQRNDVSQYTRDRRKYSVARGNNKYIARARDALESMEGGMDLLLSLVSFDVQSRASALDALNSQFMIPLREATENPAYGEQDEVLSYNAFSIQK